MKAGNKANSIDLLLCLAMGNTRYLTLFLQILVKTVLA